MLDSSTNLEKKNDNTPPLIKAVNDGDSKKVKNVLENGADINAQDNKGYTALMWAIHWGDKGLVQLLTENNPKPRFDLIDNEGNNAFSLAINSKANRPENMLHILLEIGRADINTQDGNGDTPLMIAVKNQDKSTVNYLLTRQSNVKHENKEGKTALMLAVEKEDLDIIKLIDNKVIDATDYNKAYNLANSKSYNSIISFLKTGPHSNFLLTNEPSAEKNIVPKESGEASHDLTSYALAGAGIMNFANSIPALKYLATNYVQDYVAVMPYIDNIYNDLGINDYSHEINTAIYGLGAIMLGYTGGGCLITLPFIGAYYARPYVYQARDTILNNIKQYANEENSSWLETVKFGSYVGVDIALTAAMSMPLNPFGVITGSSLLWGGSIGVAHYFDQDLKLSEAAKDIAFTTTTAVGMVGALQLDGLKEFVFYYPVIINMMAATHQLTKIGVDSLNDLCSGE